MQNLTHRVVRLTVIFSALLAIGPLCSVAQVRDPKICLVLSGGGARGAAHIGVLKALEQERIPIDCIVGTSFGALAGGLYSAGYTAAGIEQIMLGQDWSSIFSDAPQRHLMPILERRNVRYQVQLAFERWNIDLPPGLWEGQRMIESLDLLTTSQILDANHDFDRLPIQFRAVATNLLDGKAFIFKEGRLTQALRSSLAIPLVFTPVDKDGMLLVDGGLANNLPVDIARSLGADIIVAVDVTSPLLKKNQIHNFINVIDQAISLQMERNIEANRKSASILLRPDLQEFTSNDYDQLSKIIRIGEAEAFRRMGEIKNLVSGAAAHPHVMQTPNVVRIIDSVSFEGLKQLKASEVKKQARLHVHAGDTLDLSELVGDLGRLYATRLFEVVDYRLDLVDGNRYLLTYLVKESSTKILGLGLRYDNDYGFVALGEFSARQLFGGASSATISSQFGGLEEYSASLHLIPSLAPSLFLEPRIGFRKQQRLDFRNQELVNTFTDRRTGGRLIAGGTLFHFLEAEGGYHRERVRIRGGSNLDPSTVSPAILAGLTFGLYRDTLDHPEFPRGGARSQLLIEKQSTALGSDFDYSRWQMDYQRYFAFSDKSTVLFNAGAGFTRGSVPFYDLFFVGGHSHAVGASRPFLGLDRDEIRANQMFILGASYQRQIFSSSLGFVKRGYAVGAYNGLWFSARQKTPYQFDRINGFGGGIAINTMFGPVRAMVGLAEGGRAHFYINIGPRF